MPRKTPLVLLPGLLCDAAMWGHHTQTLADIAESSVADVTRADQAGLAAQQVIAFAPEEFALAGLSMGGYIALEIMRQAPDRVIRLALLDTSAHPDTQKMMKFRQELINLARIGQFKGVTRRLLPKLVHPDRLADD